MLAAAAAAAAAIPELEGPASSTVAPTILLWHDKGCNATCDEEYN